MMSLLVTDIDVHKGVSPTWDLGHLKLFLRYFNLLNYLYYITIYNNKCIVITFNEQYLI